MYEVHLVSNTTYTLAGAHVACHREGAELFDILTGDDGARVGVLLKEALKGWSEYVDGPTSTSKQQQQATTLTKQMQDRGAWLRRIPPVLAHLGHGLAYYRSDGRVFQVHDAFVTRFAVCRGWWAKGEERHSLGWYAMAYETSEPPATPESSPEPSTWIGGSVMPNAKRRRPSP